MVAKDFNHPSVILYSIGNEIPETGSPAGAAWGRKLAEKVRSLDGTRYVTNAINGMLAVLDQLAAMRSQPSEDAGINTLMANPADMMNAISASEAVPRRTAESFSVLDVAGINYAEARYDLDRDLFPNRIIVGSETFPTRDRRQLAAGQAARQRHRGLHLDRLGLPGRGRHRPPAVRDAGRLAARTHRAVSVAAGGLRRHRHHRAPPAGLLLPGDRLRPARPALSGGSAPGAPRADLHRDARGRGATRIASWTWPGSEGAPVTVEVYSDADEVELLVNGRSLGRQPTGDDHRFRAEFETFYQPGELVAVAYAGGAETGRHVVRSAVGPVQLRAEADRPVITAGGGDLAYVTLTLTDPDGTCYTQADRPVAVEVTGQGVLLGFGSAAPCTEERFDAIERRTHDGRALAVLRPTGPGKIRLLASAPDCEPTEITVTVE